MILVAWALSTASLAAAAPGPLARIVAGESASRVLTTWCADRHLPPFRAESLPGSTPIVQHPPGELRAGGRRVAYRRVRLSCGARTLSTADNWYLPSRLTPDMNRRLGSARTPFGLVVRPLRFRRRTLSSGPGPNGRFVVRAVLVDSSGAPFSYVVERYDPRLR